MRITIAFCAVLVGLGCAPAFGAPLRAGGGLFDKFPPRPPRAIPHARQSYSAIAPMPRPKPGPESAPTAAPPQLKPVPQLAPAAASPPGPITFPPVTPLE
jgi:hypothetical protein